MIRSLLILALSCASLYAQVLPAIRMLPAGSWDRTKVGVEGGIPNYTTIVANVKADFGAVGNGVADDTTAFNAALRYAADHSNFGGVVVYVPPGDYKTVGTIYQWSTSAGGAAHNVVLRGAGPTLTKLHNTGGGGTIIEIQSMAGMVRFLARSRSCPRNTTTVTVTLSGVSTFAGDWHVGDYIVLYQAVDPTWADNNPGYELDSIGQRVKITAVNGSNITFSPGAVIGVGLKP